jgi:hypothetical protein
MSDNTIIDSLFDIAYTNFVEFLHKLFEGPQLQGLTTENDDGRTLRLWQQVYEQGNQAYELAMSCDPSILNSTDDMKRVDLENMYSMALEGEKKVFWGYYCDVVKAAVTVELMPLTMNDHMESLSEVVQSAVQDSSNDYNNNEDEFDFGNVLRGVTNKLVEDPSMLQSIMGAMMNKQGLSTMGRMIDNAMSVPGENRTGPRISDVVDQISEEKISEFAAKFQDPETMQEQVRCVQQMTEQLFSNGDNPAGSNPFDQMRQMFSNGDALLQNVVQNSQNAGSNEQQENMQSFEQMAQMFARGMNLPQSDQPHSNHKPSDSSSKSTE